jgi:integrase/recombinase XerC
MFQSAVNKFLDHLQMLSGASEHTLRSYENDLNQLFLFLKNNQSYLHLVSPEKIPLASCDRKIIRAFIVDLRDHEISKRSVARKLSTLRSFFRFCQKEHLLVQNPMELIDTPKLDHRVPITLTYAQIQQFFSLPDLSTYLGLRDRTIMELFYSSGLRVSELAGLNREDVDRIGLLLHVRGKGKKERLTPITENAMHWVKNYLEHPERHMQTVSHYAEIDHEAIFLNKWGKRLTTRSIDRLFNDYLQESGFAETITPHVIRHTIATHWLEHGMDLKTIQLLLGHSSMATTTIYTEVSSDLKKKVVNDCHPRA